MAFSDSSIHVLETNAYGTLNWTISCKANLAAGTTFGPLVITPSTSKKQAKFD